MNYISCTTTHVTKMAVTTVKKGIDYPHYHHNETRPEECHAKLPACIPSILPELPDLFNVQC